MLKQKQSGKIKQNLNLCQELQKHFFFVHRWLLGRQETSQCKLFPTKAYYFRENRNIAFHFREHKNGLLCNQEYANINI